jgi:predicted metal-dependent hydrolase
LREFQQSHRIKSPKKDAKTLEIDGVGPVLFERSKRAKHLNISVTPYKGVRVAIPDGLSFKKAEEFVHSRTDWIKKHLDRMKQFEREHAAKSGTALDIDRAKAKRKLSRRLNYLSEKYGFTYNRVFIRNQRTRWGSCSHKDNISLNMKLIRLPDELMDYVILHELVHTRFKNHSKQFWDELDKILVNAKGIDALLKQYTLELL